MTDGLSRPATRPVFPALSAGAAPTGACNLADCPLTMPGGVAWTPESCRRSRGLSEPGGEAHRALEKRLSAITRHKFTDKGLARPAGSALIAQRARETKGNRVIDEFSRLWFLIFDSIPSLYINSKNHARKIGPAPARVTQQRQHQPKR